jgi:pyridoxine kinase
MKTILSIQSQVAGALVGNSVAAFAIERLGVRVLQLPTALLGRRPDRGLPGGGPVPNETMGSVLGALDDDGALAKVDAVISGYLAHEEQTAIIFEAIDRVRAHNPAAIYVCDPVLGDDGAMYVSERVADAVLNGLAPRADWLAPNLYEFGLIAGRPIETLEAAQSAARRLGRPTLLSSVTTDTGIGNLFAAPAGDWFCQTPRLPDAPGAPIRGAGDLLTALFVARRMLGQAPAVALEASTGAVHDVMVRSLALGGPHLALPAAQDLLVEPLTWPTAMALAV